MNEIGEEFADAIPQAVADDGGDGHAAAGRGTQPAGGIELAAAENPVCDIGFIGLNEPGTSDTPWQVKSIRCSKKQRDLFDAQRLTVEI